jgi:murein L,D-transpeptidase YafK
VYRNRTVFEGVGLSSSGRVAGAAAILISALFFWGAAASPAFALSIELDDVAPDRIERQRAFARGNLPGATAPDSETFKDRLSARGLVEGAPILIRIFKAESELELWMRKGDAFVLQGTYPICHWTGSLGPKLREGDKQSPEGFYTIGAPQMRHRGRWQQAFNLGYPNLHDKTLQRTGSYILVHGGCSSAGCFAMTQPVQREIHRLASAALRRGQARFQLHIFPFRMTEDNLAKHADSPWVGFWRDLKAGYDAFEQTRLPPHLNLCGQRYVVTAADRRDRTDGPLTRIDARKVAAAGLDPSICRIDPVPSVSSSPVATAPDREPAAAAAVSEGGETERPRAVFRVERRAKAVEVERRARAVEQEADEPPPPGWRLARPPSRESRSSRSSEAAADKRARLIEERRARRSAVNEMHRRNRASFVGRNTTP